jgi:hypothetical protein
MSEDRELSDAELLELQRKQTPYRAVLPSENQREGFYHEKTDD